MSDGQPPSEPKASLPPAIRFGHNRFPPGVCAACYGRGFLRRIDAAGSLDDETCKACNGTGKVQP